jgi:hypothetical protein
MHRIVPEPSAHHLPGTRQGNAVTPIDPSGRGCAVPDAHSEEGLAAVYGVSRGGPG